MRPIFANSAWVNARETLLLRGGRWRKRRLKVRYGLFIHPTVGPVLIDTGYTTHCLDPHGISVWLRIYGRLLAPELIEQGQVRAVLNQFGLSPEAIKTVIVTHFHVDHISGLSVFPNAKFIASISAWTSLQRNNQFQNIQHGMFPELLPEDFATRFVPLEDQPLRQVPHLQTSHDIFGDGSVLAVPLHGHASGHFGVLFPQEETPLLYATDTQLLIDALPRDARPRLAPRLIAEDTIALNRSADRVYAFQKSGGTVILCHDDAPNPFDIEEGATF